MLRSNNMNMANGREFDRTYDRLERAAIAAARRNNAMLLYVPDAPGAALQFALGAYSPAYSGSPVGRLLDMQYGAPTLGKELLSNTTFDGGTAGWTPFFNTTISAVSGKLRVGTTTGAGQPMLAIAAVATTPGQTYQLSASSASKTAQVGVFQLQATNNSNGSGSFATASFGVFGAQTLQSSIAITFIASAAVTYVVLRADSGASATTADYSEWDGISVRRVIDAPASRGPELVSNGDFSSWSGDNPVNWGLSYVESATEYVTQGNPGARIVSTTGNFNEIAQVLGLVNGKTYEVIVQVTACTGTGSVSNASASPVSFSAPGYYRAIFTAVGGSVGLKRATGGQASDFTVGSISVKEVLGFHCNQATASSKPTVVKIPRRRGPELVVNGDFNTDLSGWSTGNTGVATVTWSAGTALYGSNGVDGARLRQQIFVTPGKTYWISVSASSALNIAIGANPGTTEYVPYFAGSKSFAFVAFTNSFWINTVTAVDGSFLDKVSIFEVLEWSNAVQFDGTDDWLDVTFRDYYAAGASTFIGAWNGPVTGNSSFGLVQSNTGNNTPLYAPLGVPTGSSNASYFMRDDAGSAVLNFRTYAAGAYSGSGVVSAVDSGNRLVGLDRGAVSVDVTFARPGVLSTNKVTIGASQRTTVFGFAKMTVALLCWSPNVMPDADRRAIEKFAAFLVGEHHA